MRRIVFALAATGVACAESPRPAADPVVLSEFEGFVDPAHGRFELGPSASTQGLSPITVFKDNIAGEGPVNTIELVSTEITTAPTVCGGSNRWCVDVELRSFYNDFLGDVWCQITTITPVTNHEAVNSDDGSAVGLDNTLGLWSFGSFGTQGSYTRKWTFRDLDGSSWRFKGRCLANRTTTPPVVASNAFYDVTVEDFTFEDISNTGTQFNLGDDGVQTLATFPFTFFGTSYSQINVSANGFLSFTSNADGCCEGQVMPNTTAPNAVIAAYWHDLNPPAGGAIYAQSDATHFIVQWDQVANVVEPTRTITAQIVLFTDNRFEIRILDASARQTTLRATTGAEDATGTSGFHLQNLSVHGHAGFRRWLFTPQAP